MTVYGVFGSVWKNSHDVDVLCFGIFTTPEIANNLLESLKKDTTIDYGFVQEFVCDKETNEQIMCIE